MKGISTLCIFLLLDALVYNMKAAKKNTDERVSALPTTPVTASVWIGCTANNMAATKLDSSGRNIEHILKYMRQTTECSNIFTR
jgi:hypothetical protein